jgi:predicted RNase H-like HicB family nuclease
MSESCVMLHVERLPEGGYLATSEDIQGLVAQGRTVAETLEIAREVARRLLDAQQEKLILDHTLGEQSDTLRYY